MNETLGLILTGINDNPLGELTQARSLAAVPFCGRYRLIDFVLSAMVNSGISNVGVPTLTYYRSLMDHLGSGKEWDLNRKLDGLFILPPYINRESTDSRGGDLDVLNGIMDYISHSSQKYVLLTSADTLFNTTFFELYDSHASSHADVTVMSVRAPGDCRPPMKSVLLDTDGSGRVTDIEVGVARCRQSDLISMGIYYMEKSFLEHQISRCISRGLHDFVMDVLIKNINSANIRAFVYGGYVGRIDSIHSYYRANMSILDPDICAELFNPETPVYTKVKDQVPTIYGENARVSNSIIADGCRINGTVENSVIFRGVTVEENARVSNSIVMQNAQIQKNVGLDYAVLDKNVVIRCSKRLMGQDNYPVIIGKNAII